MKLKNNGQVVLTSQEEEFLITLIHTTGIELWSADCDKRILAASGDGVRLCSYDDPLHGKDYVKVQSAINAILRESD